jgi:transcriptional regulator with XRE-family HTH domain
MEPASNIDRDGMPEIHPFKILRLKAGKTGKQAAAELGITPEWLSQIEMGRVDPSMELYRDMVTWSKGKLTLKKLIAHRKPSEHRRRKLIDVTPLRKARKAAADQVVAKPNGKDKLH